MVIDISKASEGHLLPVLRRSLSHNGLCDVNSKIHFLERLLRCEVQEELSRFTWKFTVLITVGTDQSLKNETYDNFCEKFGTDSAADF